jgi:hypothetical protein
VRRGSGIRRQVRASGILLGEVRRKAFVEAFDRYVDRSPELVHESLGLDRLLATLAAKRQRYADHDALGSFARDQPDEPFEPGLRGDPLDHADRSCERPGRI